jgi:hypothetical protein
MTFQLCGVRAWVAGLVLTVSLVSACGGGSRLDGLYVNSTGQNTIEFREGKAFITIPGGGSEAIPYDVKGDTITVRVGGMAGDLVLTRNGDGTLQGPFGIMRKK